MTMAEIAPTTAERRTGANQFPTEAAVAFTSSKPSPGTANTFNSRAANDIVGGFNATDCGSRTGGGCSIESILNRKRPNRAMRECRSQGRLSSPTQFGQYSGAQRHFYARFNAEVFGDAFDDQTQVARRRVAAAIQHPVQCFLTQAGLPRQFLEGDFGVNQVA